MEPEVSLPRSQLPATGLCPDPDASRRPPYNLLHFNIILPSASLAVCLPKH